jgi:hypothetical protein
MMISYAIISSIYDETFNLHHNLYKFVLQKGALPADIGLVSAA